MKKKKRISDDELLNCVSSTCDCTGLMPTPPKNNEELSSYRDIVDFDNVSKTDKNG